MKARHSHQPGQVVFYVSRRDIALLARAGSVPKVITSVEEAVSFQEELNQRANQRTHLLEEILSHSDFPSSQKEQAYR